MTAPIVRHPQAPSPDGCRWCGDARHHHGHQWVPSVGMHAWTEPTREQRLARMTARRTRRSNR